MAKFAEEASLPRKTKSEGRNLAGIREEFDSLAMTGI
jgi:hypothetical protein